MEFLALILVACIMPLCHSQRQSSLFYSIMENIDANKTIGNIASDKHLPETDNSTELIFSVVPRDSNTLAESMFEINSTTGDIQTGFQLDREMICAQMEECLVKLDVELQPAQYFEIIRITIEILDQNDNSPTFEDGTVRTWISEEAAVGSALAIKPAFDPDSPGFGVQRYDQVSDSTELSLSYNTDLETEEIYLLLKSSLDREAKDELHITIYAYDGGTPPKSASVNIIVEVRDTNDNSPSFDQAVYEIDVAEDFEVDKILSTIQATDPDEGENGEVLYRFTSRTQSSYSDIFSIGRETGEIKLLQSLDYEEMDRYTLNIIAENAIPGASSAQTMVHVNVFDINDNAPEITVSSTLPSIQGSSVVEVEEEMNIGSFVVHIAVTDRDSAQNSAILCELVDPSRHFKLAALSLTDYKILTSNLLDRESTDEHKVKIVCEDQGIPSLSTEESIIIRVADSNDNAPIFEHQLYMAGLTLITSKGTFIAHTSAYDADIGDNSVVTYSLRGEEGLFNIDRTNGTITVAHDISMSTTVKWINFTVIATDTSNTPLSSEVIVAVQVFSPTDLVPFFTKTIYALTVSENLAIGTEVGRVELRNPMYPNFKPYRFQFVESSTIFTIDETSGEIRTNKVLDREARENYNLRVSASVGTSTSTETTVTIRILDMNDQLPYFIFPSKRNNTLYITPDTEPSNVIVRVTAKDTDSGENSRLTYSIFSGDPLALFIMDPDSGDIILAQDLRSVDPQKFSLTIKAEDNGEPMLSEEASLNIIMRQSSALNGKIAIYLGVAFGAGFMLIILIIAIVIVTRKQKRTAKKCKKVEKMLDEKMKSLENMSNKLVDMSHGSSEMGAHGFITDSKRSSFSQNPSFVGDRDSDSGCSADLSNPESAGRRPLSTGVFSALPNGRGSLWDSHIPEDGPYQDMPHRHPYNFRPCVNRSLSASHAEVSPPRSQDKRLSFPVGSSAGFHGYLDDGHRRDASVDSSDSEQQQAVNRLPGRVYSRLAQFKNEHMAYIPDLYNGCGGHGCNCSYMHSDDDIMRPVKHSDDESGHRSDTALMRSHIPHGRRLNGTRKKRRMRQELAMIPMTQTTASIVNHNAPPPVLPNHNVPSSNPFTANSLSESDIAPSNSTDSRQTGICSSDEELGVTQV